MERQRLEQEQIRRERDERTEMLQATVLHRHTRSSAARNIDRFQIF